MISFKFFLIINFGALIAAAGGIFLKNLSNQLNHDAPFYELVIYTLKNLNFWIGGFCYIFPILLWTYLLKFMDLTKLQPILSVVYLYTIILAVIFLGESISMGRLFGIVLIMMGVFFVSRS